MKIGPRIKDVLTEQGRNARWLADRLPCERTNVYDIFKRDDMNIKLLARICQVMEHDFFAELSRDTIGKEQA